MFSKAFTCRAPTQARVSRGNTMAVRAELQCGAKVKVVAPITVYHVGKFKGGLNLEGKEGVVVQNVSDYQGQTLSANLPWKVEFQVPGPEGKNVKVLAHLEEDEVQAV